MGLGVIVRTRAGDLRLAGVKRSLRQWDSEMAEAMAVDFAVEVARRFHFSDVEIQLDFHTVKRILKGESSTHLDLGRVCNEIKEKAAGLGHIRWEHVERKWNESAHFLAHWDCCWEREMIWVDSPPDSLVTLILKDNYVPNPN
ncbi:unnamed protein product [Linum trigynum]|uniref:RNase H type-1 domain-containing protein n=1 Tax=Linum trigynum TaxID=586398 RepID=A0AAV2G0C8_9ROSI